MVDWACFRSSFATFFLSEDRVKEKILRELAWRDRSEPQLRLIHGGYPQSAIRRLARQTGHFVPNSLLASKPAQKQGGFLSNQKNRGVFNVPVISPYLTS